MKTKSIKPMAALLVTLSVITTACGKASAQDAEQLPNQRVPLFLSAHEASRLKEEIFSRVKVLPPEQPDARTLLLTASRLAQLSEIDYLSIQQKWLGSNEAACNFFVITSLCESGYCKKDKPFYRAAEFGTYFKESGWAEVTLEEAKKFLEQASDIDLVAQRGPVGSGTMGHIGIPVRLDAQRNLVVAQGNYHQASHEVEVWIDRFAHPFHFFVNFAPGVDHVSP